MEHIVIEKRKGFSVWQDVEQKDADAVQAGSWAMAPRTVTVRVWMLWERGNRHI